MKNKKSVLLVSLLLLIGMVVMVGCTNDNAPAETQPTEMPTEASTEISTEAPTTQENVTPITYELIPIESLDAEVQNDLERLKQSEGYYVWDDANGKTLFVGMGLKPTGGFGIEVEKIESVNGVIEVSMIETVPAPDAMVTQALTYPFVMIQFNTDVNTEAMVVRGLEDKEYAALTLALEDALVVEGTYVGQIDNNSIEVTVGDGFMVMRNFLMSELVMGFEEGDLVKITYTETEEGQYQLIQMEPVE